MAHCAIVACRSAHFRHQIKMAIKEKMPAVTTTIGTSSVLGSHHSSSTLSPHVGGNRSSLTVLGSPSTSSSSQSSAAATAAAVARFRSSSPASLMFVNNEMPPFYLNPDDYVEIKVGNESAEPFRLVLEFLYTDQILSLEGRGSHLFYHQLN